MSEYTTVAPLLAAKHTGAEIAQRARPIARAGLGFFLKPVLARSGLSLSRWGVPIGYSRLLIGHMKMNPFLAFLVSRLRACSRNMLSPFSCPALPYSHTS
jgi:hypothetical protein